MHVVHTVTDAPWTQTCKYKRVFSSRHGHVPCTDTSVHAQTHHATYMLSNSGSQTPRWNVENNFPVSLCDLKSLMLLKRSDTCPWQGCGRAWDAEQGVKPLVHVLGMGGHTNCMKKLSPPVFGEKALMYGAALP